jgi:hypothetical protein
MAVPQLWLFATGLPPQWPRLDTRSGHVGFVDKIPLRHVSPEYFGVPTSGLSCIPLHKLNKKIYNTASFFLGW